MKKGKTLTRQVLAWILSLTMVMSMAPVSVYAEENAENTGCSHIHDENCGGLAQEEPDETEAGISEELKALQERINALPTGDEYKAMTEEEQEAVYERAAAVSEAYIDLSEEDQDKLDITRMEELFAVINEGNKPYSGTVNFLNSGYPYGKAMDSSYITLVIEAEGSATSFQWQVADSETGSFTDISGATASTYTFTPTSGKWYRCVVDGTESKAVMAVKPGSDGRTWTKPYSSWYISNGAMAYMVSGTIFDAVGLYTKNGTDYMLCTSYNSCWYMYSSTSATPDAVGYGSATAGSLDTLRVSFDEKDDYNVIFEADLADGQQAFSFGCDTQLGNSTTSGSYSDSAALNAMVKNGALQQVAMIGAGTVEGAADTDPAFVIAPIDPVSRFWIGDFSSRQAYAYNTATSVSGVKASETIDGVNVVTLLEGADSGMTMSWMNIPSGGTVKFRFSVGDVAHTGAVSGKVDYEKEMLTGLDPNTSYTITDGGGTTYTVITNENGEIPLSGTDQGGTSYDFTGQKITIAKTDSEDTPAEIEVSDRPDTPDTPSDLEDEGNTPTVDANIEIVELTTTSVTISPKAGQQYAYSIDGTNWMTLTSTNTDENGNYVIAGLSEGATIQIRTRVSATSDRPASQWSDPKDVKLKSTVKASAAGWSGNYDGDVHSISVTVTSPAEGATITYSSTTGENYSESKPEFRAVGEYTVYYRVIADGYYPAYGSTTVKIEPKEVELEWSNTAFTYNNKPQKPKAKVTNLEEGDEVTIIVSGEKSNANTREELDSENSGYTATAVALEGTAKENYKLSDIETDNQKKFKIYPKKITAAMVNAATAYTYTGSIISPTISLEDYVSGMDGKLDKKVLVKDSDYSFSGTTLASEVGSYAITVTGTGNYTGTVEVEYKITDSSAPTGTIQVTTSQWKSLLDAITFDIFYKARQTVTITAEDEGSGVDRIYYYLTSRGEAVDQETLAALPDTKWTEISNGGSFTIDPDNKYVIYAKIMDKSGNVTFISSNGIVLDKSAPIVTGIERNKTYCSDVTFAVSDAIGLASVKIDDKEQGVGGSYTIEAAGERKTHIIVAGDTAGNKTTYIIAINADGEHSFEPWNVVTPATCEQKGIRSHTCSACGFVETEEIPALGHDYKADANEDAHFVWIAEKDAEGIVTGYKATAYFICNRDSSHTDKVQECIVTRGVTKPATEQEEGTVVYTATATYKGKDYYATKTATLAKLTKLDDPAAAVNSSIYTSTSVADNAPATTIGDELDVDLAKDLMTPAEEANYNNAKVATDITLYLEVQNITGAVAPEETQKVEAQIADLVTEKINTDADVEVETGATYLDLSMYKNVKTKEETPDGKMVGTSDDTTQITDTGKEITITVKVPSDIPKAAEGFTRTYTVVRVHEGNAQALDTQQSGNLLTFSTSKFSTYAITYVDVKNAPDNPPSGGDSEPVIIPVDKVSITANKDEITRKEESVQLSAVVEPANATEKKVTWISSDPKVATVDENGKVTAVGDGTVTITAKTSNGKTATITITVKTESGSTDIKLDTSYRTLRLRIPTTTKTTNVLKWTKVADADGYVIYGNQCDTKKHSYKMVKKVVIKDHTTTTWTDRNLKSGTYYKYYIKAYKLVNGKKVWLAKSKVVHSTTTGGKYGNAKTVKVNKTTVSLTVGKTFAIKAEQVIKDKPIDEHQDIKFESGNTKVASVTGKGVIKAKKKGTCYIYVYAQNGMYQRIKVTVK